MAQAIGPVILDLKGMTINPEEREILQHPLVGGVILFSRNYENPTQIKELCDAIRKTRKMPLLITVDQEGGRVQRFRDGFTRISPMAELGQLYDKSPAEALQLAEQTGSLLASELLDVGVDLSFAPVLDLNKELATVIGDRAFHSESNVVIMLAKSIISGMHKAGMAATGKHFPGHGTVKIDSHHAMPVDKRDFKKIAEDDMLPFIELIRSNINALMPAHILFPAIDDKPVCFSRRWLHDILRQQLQFKGVIVSDDLNMKGADMMGNYSDRALYALKAGCDFILICNNPQGAISILDRLSPSFSVSLEKFKSLQGKFYND